MARSECSAVVYCSGRLRLLASTANRARTFWKWRNAGRWRVVQKDSTWEAFEWRIVCLHQSSHISKFATCPAWEYICRLGVRQVLCALWCWSLRKNAAPIEKSKHFWNWPKFIICGGWTIRLSGARISLYVRSRVARLLSPAQHWVNEPIFFCVDLE